MKKYVSTSSFSVVPKGDDMDDALANPVPVETAEDDLQTMTVIPLSWFAWGGGSSWLSSLMVVDGGGCFT